MYDNVSNQILKEAYYEVCFANTKGKVAYVVLNNICIFTGVTEPGSTINYAEEIILQISKQENIDIEKFKFFDLQTHLGYRKNTGDLNYDRLILESSKGKLLVKSWDKHECPKDIKLIFAAYIF